MKISTYTIKNIAGRARKRVERGEEDFETILRDLLKDLANCATLPQQLQGFIRPVYRAAASEFGVLEHSIMGRRQARLIVRARHAVALMCRKLGLTLQETATAMSRDASSVRHAEVTARELLTTDNLFANAFANMERRLRVEYDLDPVEAEEMTR